MRGYLITDPAKAQKPCRFAQVVINPIRRNDDGTHNCYASNRVELPLQQKQGVEWLRSYIDLQDDDISAAIRKDPHVALMPFPLDPLELAEKAVIGAKLAAVEDVEGGIVEKVTALLKICKENNYDWAVRTVIDTVMQKTFPEPGNPPDPSIDLGYIVMAGSGQTERGFKTLEGTAVEAAFSFFPTVPSQDQPGLQIVVPDAISFVDKVLNVFDQHVNNEDAPMFPAGWLSLRVTGRTEAFLGMERFQRNGTVELVLFGRPDGYAIVQEIERLALDAGGTLHWGQSNGMISFLDLEQGYGNTRIDKWKDAQRKLGGDTFVNLFMKRCGLA
jgi:hypothetical protein